MTTAVIIQARMGSTRLPGKVMMGLRGKTVIARVIERCAKIPGIDALWCAVPEGEANTALAREARRRGAAVFCGSESNVLSRYYRTAKAARADVIVRITADCPLIDPDICAKVIALRRSEAADYASNVWPRSFPQGLDCEVFTFAALERAHAGATAAADREHVTPFIARSGRRVNLPSGRFDLSNKRWTLDYPEDLAFFRAIWSVREPKGMDDVLDILAEHPEFEEINAARRAA